PSAGREAVSAAREVASAGSAAAAPARAPVTSSDVRHGVVLDANGLGLAGVWVGFDPGVAGAPAPVVSGADGGFDLPDLSATVQSRDERFATILASRLDPALAQPEDEHVVVVAPAVALGGVVRDTLGAPAAGVLVRMEIPLSFRGRFRAVLDHSPAQPYGATT